MTIPTPLDDAERGRLMASGVPPADQITEIRERFDAAQPGQWYVHDRGIRRFDGTAVDTPESLVFMAASVLDVPALLRFSDILIDTLRVAWAVESNTDRARQEILRRMNEASTRAADGKTGPPEGVVALAEVCLRGTFRQSTIVEFLVRWTGGEDILPDIEPWIRNSAQATWIWGQDGSMRLYQHNERRQLATIIPVGKRYAWTCLCSDGETRSGMSGKTVTSLTRILERKAGIRSQFKPEE